MNTHGPATLRLSRPPAHRLADALADFAVWLQGALQRHRDRRRQARALATLAELSDATLRDIGAPDWLRAEADARRDADRQRLVEMNLGMPRHG